MSYRIVQGDVLKRLGEMADESAHCVVTSPPYWGLRDYGVAGQMGLERTPADYLVRMVEVFREVRRVLRRDGTCWMNMGDGYATGTNAGRNATSTEGEEVPAGWSNRNSAVRMHAHGLKPKDLIGMPWRLAFALQEDGWWLRQDIIWSKPNPMPESVTDRCTKAHEYVFLLTKSARYFYDAEATKEQAATESLPSPAGWDMSSGDGAHGTIHRSGRNGKNSLRGQGSNRDTGSGPANPVGRDMNTVGVGAKRNKRSVWEIVTEAFPEAHFATFPTKLVEPCILAGTSERGCCADCGAPWVRVVDVGYENPGNRTTNGSRSLENRKATAGFEQRLERRTSTVGWERSCDCEELAVERDGVGAEMPVVRPCVVLDPFSGAGTTGLVALRLGREYIGIELNPEYVAMSERRLREDAPLLRALHVEDAPAAQEPEQCALALTEDCHGAV